MFSSLASFLFGSNTNCDTTATATETGVSEQNSDTNVNLEEVENLIEVTSLTPSVTGAGDKWQTAIRRGKNKRNNARQQNKRKGIKAPLPLNPIESNIKSSDEEEFDEDEWFIVEKEGEEKDISPVRSDSEEENVPVVEVSKINNTEDAASGKNLAQERRLLPSPYNRTRPQKPRNNNNKTRNNTNNRPNKGLSVSTLSPSRTVSDGRNRSGRETPADGGITRSLYLTVGVLPQSDGKMIIATNGIEAFNNACLTMEESWFITPPPCFTSIGPISMETSPYENLLIEHPSMSVYHSIRKAQDATESLTEYDIAVNDMDETQEENETAPKKNSQAVQTRSAGPSYRLDRQCMVQLKQELMARNVQKVQIKKERSDICRTAIKRSNKARDVQSKNHTQRRSDRQHIRICSNANNNRKSNSC